MSWITIIWSAGGGICLALAGVHLLVWVKSRDSWVNLIFSVAATAAAANAVLELSMMHAQTPEQYGEILRWVHVPVGVIVISIVWFTRLYLRAGRLWLAWLICGLQAVGWALNFLVFEPNLNFREITGLHQMFMWGETVVVAVGEKNPWTNITNARGILFLLFVLDAAIAAWRQGNRRRAGVVGSTFVCAIAAALVLSELLNQGNLPVPFTVSLCFLIMVLGMAYELSVDLVRANQLSRELSESQERMRLAASAANLGLWEWDMRRNQIWASGAGRALIGATESERITFDGFLQSVHPDDRESTRKAVRRALENSEEFQAEYQMVIPNGATRWVVSRGQVERNQKGDPLRMRGVAMDVTERKQAEAELREQRAELAHVQRVSAMGQLSSALAHEINQPLGAILRNSEAAELFLQRDPPDLEELRAILADIRRDEQRAVAVIERMRSLLKRRELQFGTLAVDNLVEQIAALLHSEFQARHVTLRVEAPHGLPQVRGDRVHLQQVILNLLLNSLDASDGQPRGQVVIRASQTEDGMVEIAVVDRAGGVPPDLLPHLFEPFFTTKSKGTGIGLAISKTIVELHGGQISAENNPDGGATVRFTLKVDEQGRAV